MLRLLVQNCETDISVTLWRVLGNGVRSVGVASASPLSQPDTWWVNRVLIQPQFREKRIGKYLVSRLVESVKERGIKSLMVSPGGYNTPPETLDKFYTSCGFKKVDEEGLYVLDIEKVSSDKKEPPPFEEEVEEKVFKDLGTTFEYTKSGYTILEVPKPRH